MSVTAKFASPRTSVNTHLKLEAHYTERTGGSFSFGTTEMTFAFGSGLTVQMPIPFLPIGEELGIVPAITVDGDSALRLDFTRWSPLRYGFRGVHGFPFTFTGQEFAAKVCRAFDADLQMTWRHTNAEIEAWLRRWGPANGLTF
jgi:hypothetical protein